MKIKITYKLLNKVYDELYQRAINLNRKHNPCKICDNTCLVYNNPEKRPFLCCSPIDLPGHDNHCKHWKRDKGCTVQSLRCKLWWCESTNDGKMPSVTYRIFSPLGKYLGYTRVPIRDYEHLALITEMKSWRFNLMFREGKVKSVKAAYESFKRGEAIGDEYKDPDE